jgi:hypothetical protein
MGDLIAHLDPAQLAKAWHAHPGEAGLVRTLKDKLGDVQLRLANLGAAAGGLVDGTRAIGEADLRSSASRRWRTEATANPCPHPDERRRPLDGQERTPAGPGHGG